MLLASCVVISRISRKVVPVDANFVLSLARYTELSSTESGKVEKMNETFDGTVFGIHIKSRSNNRYHLIEICILDFCVIFLPCGWPSVFN